MAWGLHKFTYKGTLKTSPTEKILEGGRNKSKAAFFYYMPSKVPVIFTIHLMKLIPERERERQQNEARTEEMKSVGHLDGSEGRSHRENTGLLETL